MLLQSLGCIGTTIPARHGGTTKVTFTLCREEMHIKRSGPIPLSDLDCVFRRNVSGLTAGAETACCTWLQQITGADDKFCTVSRSACEACVAASAVDPLSWNRVLPSLVYEVCSKTSRLARTNHRTIALQELRDRAERAILLENDHWVPDRIAACDVVMICRYTNRATIDAIESVLNQTDAVVFLHLLLVDDARMLREQYANHWNVKTHVFSHAPSFTFATHELIETFETPYVGFQTEFGLSLPRRIADSIAMLEREGAEIFASPMKSEHGNVEAIKITPGDFARSLLIESLVFHRATFVDLDGGIDASESTNNVEAEDFEFVYRAALQDRPFCFGVRPTVNLMDSNPSAKSTDYDIQYRSALSTPPRGFQQQQVECDVVLPFHGQLNFVAEAIKSILSQENADIVVHLIDDASPEDTTDFLNYWKSHSLVRTYRNRQNIGQFASFNNVSHFFETELAAVQDADDISLPQRLSIAGNMLRLSGSDFFGGAVRLFGDDMMVRPMNGRVGGRTVASRADHRFSFYPKMQRINYFIENPTAVFRADMFRQYGGYADFGDRLTNRGSLDTEFLMRCFFSGARFAISRQVVAKYRVHADSATQNDITGWGTTARKRSSELVAHRTQIYRSRRFDPKLFGAIGKNNHVTTRI